MKNSYLLFGNPVVYFNEIGQKISYVRFTPHLLDVCLKYLPKEEADVVLLNLKAFEKRDYSLIDIWPEGYHKHFCVPEIMRRDTYIVRLHEAIIMSALKIRGSCICNIQNPNFEMKLAAIRSNSFNIMYIKEKDEQIQLEAIKRDWGVIEVLSKPTQKAQFAAVRKSKYALGHIKNPCKAAIFEHKRRWER